MRLVGFYVGRASMWRRVIAAIEKLRASKAK
jgi:hypothetical protein